MNTTINISKENREKLDLIKRQLAVNDATIRCLDDALSFVLKYYQKREREILMSKEG